MVPKKLMWSRYTPAIVHHSHDFNNSWCLGRELFQFDNDLDILDDISNVIGKLTKKPDITLFAPENLETCR